MRLKLLLGLGLLTALAGAQTAAPAPSRQSWEKPIAPGLVYRMELQTQPPLMIHSLRYSLGSTAVRPVSELAQGRVFANDPTRGRATLTQMVQASGAVAGVNGDFFGNGGVPIGAMVREGELLSPPFRNRGVAAWGPSDFALGFLQFSASVLPEGGEEIRINGLNQECGLNEITLNTPAAGIAHGRDPAVMAIIRMDSPRWSPNTQLTGTFSHVVPDITSLPVGPDQAVIVAQGNKIPLLTRLQPGQRVSVRVEMNGFDWEKKDNAIGGGPFLLRDGRLANDWEAQGFQASFSNAKHPRTALGRTAEGDLWFTVVDGRQAISEGVTLDEMARIMQRLGCREAINLDGGGSTTLNVLGLTVNRPSGGQERAIANGVLFFGARPLPTEDRLSFAAMPELFVGDRFQVKIQGADGKEIPNAEILWAATGTAWIDQGGNLRAATAGAATVFARVRGQILTIPVTIADKPAPPPPLNSRGGARSGRGR
jgi:hypothetical protein